MISGEYFVLKNGNCVFYHGTDLIVISLENNVSGAKKFNLGTTFKISNYSKVSCVILFEFNLLKQVQIFECKH